MKITGPVHLPKQPPAVDGGYLHNNGVTECTVNDKSLEWLKFGGFGELIKFTKLSSANLL